MSPLNWMGREMMADIEARNAEKISRENRMYEIEQNTKDINDRMSGMQNQIDDVNAELRQLKNEADTTNRQLLQAQLDSQERDRENAKAAGKAQITSYISLVIGIVGAVAGVIALFK